MGIQTLGEAALSALWVPLAAGSSGRGWISLQNLDREHAFTDSDVQLLGTLAGSLGVALDNARLVHETQQRNAELALINSVQAAIAGELDPQAIYDLVGDKIQEVFDAQVVSISIYDETTGLLHFPVRDRARRAARGRADPADRLPQARARDPRAAPDRGERGGRRRAATATRTCSAASRSGRPSSCRSSRPQGDRGGCRSRTSTASTRIGDSDVRLLRTLCGSLSVALDNARLVHETRQRNAELALINSVQDSIAGELDPAGDLRPRRREAAGGLRRAGGRHRRP